jgi:hypothetical protein
MKAKILGLLAVSVLGMPLAASANVITIYGDWSAPPRQNHRTQRMTVARPAQWVAQPLSDLASVYDPNVSTADGLATTATCSISLTTVLRPNSPQR